jgi:hypothetical protein
VAYPEIYHGYTATRRDAGCRCDAEKRPGILRSKAVDEFGKVRTAAPINLEALLTWSANEEDGSGHNFTDLVEGRAGVKSLPTNPDFIDQASSACSL